MNNAIQCDVLAAEGLDITLIFVGNQTLQQSLSHLFEGAPQCEKPPMPWLSEWDPKPEDTAETRRQKWLIREHFVFFTPCLKQSRSSWDCGVCAGRWRRSWQEPPKGPWAP